MKLFLLVILLLVQNSSFSQIIKFENTTYDFGTIDYDAPSNFKLKFTNKGDKPLIISNVQGSSGCITASWPKEPIAPKASEYIVVKYDTRRVGKTVKALTVTSNCINEPIIILRISGTVRPFAELKVENSYQNFEYIQQGKVLKQSFTITNNFQFPLTHISVQGTDSNFFSVASKTSLSPAESMELELTIDTKNLLGKIDKTLSISALEMKKPSEIRVKMDVFASPLHFDQEEMLVQHPKGDSGVSEYCFEFVNTSNDYVLIHSITQKPNDVLHEIPLKGNFPKTLLAPGEKGKITISLSRDKKYAYTSNYERFISVNMEVKTNPQTGFQSSGTHVLKCLVKQAW